MEAAATLRSAGDDARSLLAAAQDDWARTVPHCPGWDTADLVRHMGGILLWMAAVVASGERVSRRSLDPAPAARLFKAFSKSRTDTVPGIGLGLYLSRRLARDLGGDLRHIAMPSGATFVLSLPVAA